MRARILVPTSVFAAALALFVVRLSAMALWDNGELETGPSEGVAESLLIDGADTCRGS